MKVAKLVLVIVLDVSAHSADRLNRAPLLICPPHFHAQPSQWHADGQHEYHQRPQTELQPAAAGSRSSGSGAGHVGSPQVYRRCGIAIARGDPETHNTSDGAVVRLQPCRSKYRGGRWHESLSLGRHVRPPRVLPGRSVAARIREAVPVRHPELASVHVACGHCVGVHCEPARDAQLGLPV